jgi:hypothetical protein
MRVAALFNCRTADSSHTVAPGSLCASDSDPSIGAAWFVLVCKRVLERSRVLKPLNLRLCLPRMAGVTCRASDDCPLPRVTAHRCRASGCSRARACSSYQRIILMFVFGLGWSCCPRADAQNFTIKEISQSSPLAGVTNEIKVKLVSDTALAAGSAVTVSGLAGAVATNPITLLDTYSYYADAREIFSDGTTQGKGAWDSGTLTLTVRSGASLNASTTYYFGFQITNPASATTSPTIYIAASGTAAIASAAMTKPGHPCFGVANGQDPLTVVVATSCGSAAECEYEGCNNIPCSTGDYSCVNGKWKTTCYQNHCFIDELAYFLDPGHTVCPEPAPCPVGTSRGTGKGEAGNGLCHSCDAGKYVSNTGSKTCQICPAGTFSANAGASTCQSCPAGKTSAAGSSSRDGCSRASTNNTPSPALSSTTTLRTTLQPWLLVNLVWLCPVWLFSS